MNRSLSVLLVILLTATGCNRGADAMTALEPVDVVTGWFDAGIVEGNLNKLVPSVSLKLRNKANEPVRSVQINAIFKRVNEPEMWGEHFTWAIQREPLAAGATTDDIVLRSGL
jgi:predicted transglutaminase-like cysteine proteinase